MSKQYSPKSFFRSTSNAFLKRYFSERGVLRDVPFDALSEMTIAPIYDAWLKLPEDVRNEIERDFQVINEMACEAGARAILDEAKWHGEELA